MKRRYWRVEGGTTDGRQGSTEPSIPGASEDEARAAYLATVPDGWVVHTIIPGEPPQKYQPPKDDPKVERFDLTGAEE